MDGRLGTDLLIVPLFVAYGGTALDLVAVPRSRTGVLPRTPAELFDLQTVTGRENLGQALILRLMSPRGCLADLGHAAYGSRLHELIGQRKTEALRGLCRAFILEAVAQEPRVEDQAVEIVFDPQAETGSSFVFSLVVQPRSGDPLALSLEVGL